MTATSYPTATTIYARGKQTTAADRIIAYLEINRPNAFSNTQLANALTLPQDSVRRVINELRREAVVIPSVETGRQWTVAGY